ncbi:Pectinesterase [Handroanthus impetiginosus]|uniref:Pectinesterase n=1 Tax=Handroanthus impetiginosus TaxID=429701 RepID=A0A2G9HPL4_9LAMI|nr:Pectinesterase [Handroanthus impetiginosus]
MTGGKFLVLGISVILVVEALIGLITGVDYKKTCVNALNAMANNESATPKDFLQAAINVAIEEVEAAMSRPADIGKVANNSQEKMAVEDCKDLLQYAIAELQASFSTVGDSNLHTIFDREAELKNWLSAVISYQQTCVDGFTTPKLKNAMSNDLLNATQLTDNALAIVTAISQILQAFNIPLNSTASSKKLLDDGFPTWLSIMDRKLLANQSGGDQPQPNAVVAQDGSGQYKTISEALAAYPKNQKGTNLRYVIYIKAGVYDESITVTKDQVNVYMYGDGPRKSIVTGKKCFTDGVSTFQTASCIAIGNGFIAKSMGFQNTAGPEGHQALALRVQSNGWISRHIVHNTVTAHGRSRPRETTGIVIQNCRIVPEQKLEPVRFKIPTYLGWPWKEYSKAIIMETALGDFIQPAGWMPWSGNFALDTCYYREYANRGPGASTDKRVKWKG